MVWILVLTSSLYDHHYPHYQYCHYRYQYYHHLEITWNILWKWGCFHLNSVKVIYWPDTQKFMEISKIVRQSKHKTESEIPNSFLQYSRSINLKYFEHSWESQTTHSSKYQINFQTQCYLKELNQFCVPMDVCPLCP